MRRAAKVDSNQQRIFDAWKRAGVKYRPTFMIGEGFPDALIQHVVTGALMLVEIKDGDKPPSKRRLTKSQQKFVKTWPVTVVEDETQALEVAGVKTYPIWSEK